MFQRQFDNFAVKVANMTAVHYTAFCSLKHTFFTAQKKKRKLAKPKMALGISLKFPLFLDEHS